MNSILCSFCSNVCSDTCATIKHLTHKGMTSMRAGSTELMITSTMRHWCAVLKELHGTLTLNDLFPHSTAPIVPLHVTCSTPTKPIPPPQHHRFQNSQHLPVPPPQQHLVHVHDTHYRLTHTPIHLHHTNSTNLHSPRCSSQEPGHQYTAPGTSPVYSMHAALRSLRPLCQPSQARNKCNVQQHVPAALAELARSLVLTAGRNLHSYQKLQQSISERSY